MIQASQLRDFVQYLEPILKSLTGNVPSLGEQVSSASSTDLAFLSYLSLNTCMVAVDLFLEQACCGSLETPQ
jgi:hypothetical protein